jgi:NAD-dependent deacetylase
LASWQSQWPTTILTQNIDDLLERAGSPEVVHLHGRLSDLECHSCGHRWDHGVAAWDPDVDRCLKCGSSREVKPGIVFFGEMAPQYRVLHSVLQSLRRQDAFVVIGTSGYVLPVAQMAQLAPCPAILNNLAPSGYIDDNAFEHVFHQPATQAVSQIEEILRDLLE